MPVTVPEITRMTPDEVDRLFREGEVGDIPDGRAEGTAIFQPGSPLEPLLQKLVHALLWQGKVFDARSGTLTNRIFPLGVRAIEAEVYRDRSWFDTRECIVLDYSTRSRVARHMRDEIRRVAPGLYLGHVYAWKTRTVYFTLQFAVA